MNFLTEEQRALIELMRKALADNKKQYAEWSDILDIIQLQGKVIEKVCEQRDTYIMLYDGPLRNFSGTKYECDLALQKIMRGTDEQS